MIRSIFTLLVIPILVSLSRAQIPIAVVEFEGKNISQSEASILTDRLRNEIFKIGAFQVLEREIVERVLAEQDFQLSGCTSNECLVEVGKLVGVREIIGGSIGKVGNVFTVSARIVDVETAKILQVTDYDYDGDIGGLLKIGMGEVAVELSDLTRLAVGDTKTPIQVSNEASQQKGVTTALMDAEDIESEANDERRRKDLGMFFILSLLTLALTIIMGQ